MIQHTYLPGGWKSAGMMVLIPSCFCEDAPDTRDGEEIVWCLGAVWDQALPVRSAREWEDRAADFAASAREPLRVQFRKTGEARQGLRFPLYLPGSGVNRILPSRMRRTSLFVSLMASSPQMENSL